MIEVVNPDVVVEQGISADEMVPGTLYKLVRSKVDTVYLKLLDGKVIWFEPSYGGASNRVNSASTEGRLFKVAPEGTAVTIKN